MEKYNQFSLAKIFSPLPDRDEEILASENWLYFSIKDFYDLVF